MIRTNHLSTLFNRLFPIAYGEYVALKEIRSKETIAISAMQSEQRIENEKADIAQDNQQSEEWREYCDDVYYGRGKQSVFTPQPRQAIPEPTPQVKRLPNPVRTKQPVASIATICGWDDCEEETLRSNKKYCSTAHRNKANYKRNK